LNWKKTIKKPWSSEHDSIGEWGKTHQKTYDFPTTIPFFGEIHPAFLMTTRVEWWTDGMAFEKIHVSRWTCTTWYEGVGRTPGLVGTVSTCLRQRRRSPMPKSYTE
jgi:hypothetical protein